MLLAYSTEPRFTTRRSRRGARSIGGTEHWLSVDPSSPLYDEKMQKRVERIALLNKSLRESVDMSTTGKSSVGPTSLVIETWEQKSRPPLGHDVPQQLIEPRSSSVTTTIGGFLGALAINGAFVGVVVGCLEKPLPISQWKPDASAAAPLILVAPLPPNVPAFSVSASATNEIDQAILIDRQTLATPPSFVTIDDAVDKPADDEGYIRQKQYGIYTGQIAARVERAWSRPRTTLSSNEGSEGSAEFECLAKILQSESGAVLEVNLLSCNGSTEWQQSLVSAIFAASPLPAPPSPTVFANSVTLMFSAHEFHAGQADDGYISAK